MVTMRQANLDAAAEQLLEARSTGIALGSLRENDEPQSIAEAYAIQGAVAKRAGPIGGWKVASSVLPEPALFAPIFAAMIFADPARIGAEKFHMIGVEAEIAFRLGRDLPQSALPRTPAEAMQAVAAVHAAIEIVDTRFVDFRAVSPLAVLADNQLSGALVVGSPVEGLLDLRSPGFAMYGDGQLIGAPQRNPIGNPIELLMQLATHCAQRGCPLKEGMMITTGSCSGVAFLNPGASVEVRLGERSLASCAFPLSGSA
jgi:2-keto-4-pentenoate hydratase